MVLTNYQKYFQSDNSANGRQQLDAESASTELDLISEDANK